MKLQIGDIVEYGLDSFGRKPETYRVSAWLRIAPPFKPSGREPNDTFDKILYEACQKIRGHRMQYCTQEEATHLSLVGVCGTIAPVNECKVVGSVKGVWSQEAIDSATQHAIELGEKHEMIF